MIPSSSPGPFATFQTDVFTSQSPADLLVFLKDVLKNIDQDRRTLPEFSRRTRWKQLLQGLSQISLRHFPSPNELPWETLHERVALTEKAFDIIDKLSDIPDDFIVLSGQDVGRDVFISLLSTTVALESRLDIAVPFDPEYPNPEVLHARARKACAQVLRCMGGACKVADTSIPLSSWLCLRDILVECLTVCDDLLNSLPTATYPLYLTFFDPPRVCEIQPHDSKERSIVIESLAAIPGLLATILEFIVKALAPPAVSQWYMINVVRQAIPTCRRVFEFLLYAPSSVADVQRIRALTRIATSITEIAQEASYFRELANYLRHELLLRRVQFGPNTVWDVADAKLCDVYQSSLDISSTLADVRAIITALEMQAWKETDIGIPRPATLYLKRCIPHLDEETVRNLKAAMSTHVVRGEYAEVFEAIENKLGASALMSIEPIALIPDWRQLMRIHVQLMVEPAELNWMDDGDTLSEFQYISRALQQIETRFEDPLYNPSSAARISLAQQLGQLACLITHDANTPCASAIRKVGISTMSVCLRIATIVLDGSSQEVTPLVRKAVFSALARNVIHHTETVAGRSLEHAAELVMRSLKDPERSVRLSAGRCFAELVRLFQDSVEEANHVEALLTLITVSYVGKLANPELLGQLLLFLVTYLGDPNPIIRGVAWTQMNALSDHHKTLPYQFLQPYMPQIAPHIVARFCTEPLALSEIARFLSLASPTDFLRVTLEHSLPSLYATLNAKAIEAVGKELGETPALTLHNYGPHILAHACLLPGGNSSKAISFIQATLKECNSEATIRSLASGYKTRTLVKFVIAMGEKDDQAADRATQAIWRYSRILDPTASNDIQHEASTLLGENLLGILTDLTNLLQGKQIPTFRLQLVRCWGPFIRCLGPPIANVGPQITATLQTLLGVSEYAEITMSTWYTFLTTLNPGDVGAFVGTTTSTFVTSWTSLSPLARERAKQCVDYVLFDIGDHLEQYLSDVADLEEIPDLAIAQRRLMDLRSNWTPARKMDLMLERVASNNVTVATRAVDELKMFIVAEDDFIRNLLTGDLFDPQMGRVLTCLVTAASRDEDEAATLRSHALECIGLLGAVDPDRLEPETNDSRLLVMHNFMDEEETVTFSLHLIQDVLVGAYRAASDAKYQGTLAYAIQELLKQCKFSPTLIEGGPRGSAPMKVRNRWRALPKIVMEALIPLLHSRYSVNPKEEPCTTHPFYPGKSTYREWIQSWATCLISKVSGERARSIFTLFSTIVRNKDVGVAYHLLPHLVLSVLQSSPGDAPQYIRDELIAVLEDQINPQSTSSVDKQALSAQTVFMVLDHLNRWVRLKRQQINSQRSERKRTRLSHDINQDEQELLRVDSILTSIDQSLMAKAALRCKAYARALMSFEQQIVVQLGHYHTASTAMQTQYEQLHEIYAHLDEPDGMEGISTLILSPSIEHQIRQHESTGNWTSAQSCWEVRLQQSPDDLASHLGLLRCLKNLGHYDTMRTHVKGILTRYPAWQPDLLGFQIESEWVVDDWDEVEGLIAKSETPTVPVAFAQILLAMRSGDTRSISDVLSNARKVAGAPLTSAGTKGYKRVYDAILDLHLMHELDMIHQAINGEPQDENFDGRLQTLHRRLLSRMESTLPAFRVREAVLGLHRTAFSLCAPNVPSLRDTVNQSWLLSAKLARKSGYWQTAYSATLQAQQNEVPFSFIESAKLTKSNGEPVRALQELEASIQLSDQFKTQSDSIIDLTKESTVDDPSSDPDFKLRAKAYALRARWMHESDRFESSRVLKAFQLTTEQWKDWESGWFHLGQFQDDCFRALSPEEQPVRGTRMNLQTVKCYSKAMKFGSKYIYQTVPRLLTLWLDMAVEVKPADIDIFKKTNNEVAKTVKSVPVWKWYTAFPQIVSRVEHPNSDAYAVLSKLIHLVIQEYPKQALWLFASVLQSKRAVRKSRGQVVMDKLRASERPGVSNLIEAITTMTEQLLALCSYGVQAETRSLSLKKHLPTFHSMAPSSLLVPLQESLIATVPPASSSDAQHQPFPNNYPTITSFHDEVDVMSSLAKPRKITLVGSDGKTYPFLGKPQDDLRKDARLMDFYAIINKLLKSNSESRRRRLRIRTYGVVTLNERCGFIQWVPNTIPIRPILLKLYDNHKIPHWSGEMAAVAEKIKVSNEKDAARLFTEKFLAVFPPVFHEWFIETFSEPAVWLASRLAYGRTAAVMSMVGFIIGLGDRHCENILMDLHNGDVIHVDFNCLFEKGKQLEIPERIPFRLTQNLVDGLGVTGVEGVFRKACEVTMQILRDNKDSLITVLDAFIHDPLVEWEEEKKRIENALRRKWRIEHSKDPNTPEPKPVEMKTIGKRLLAPIDKKFKGIYSTGKDRAERELSTTGLVQILIQEATDVHNLGRMYSGWTPWH
ncbi:unnamed protein product [Somion occarium]|uniref:non-specific serine/threonine protein kinase n=1 Tax=Somion occarium TaxID=3059160 RepID=A0ABP1CX62_9APHY